MRNQLARKMSRTVPIGVINEQLALDTVDVSGLAKYTLGESSKTLSEKQILEFVEIFKTFFSKNISNKLKDYSDQNVIITGSKKISDNYVLVNSKIISNMQEVIARGAKVLLITNKSKNEVMSENIWETIEVEDASNDLLPFLLTIPLQKLAYYSALKKGFDIDKPRNLAKSVTVE